MSTGFAKGQARGCDASSLMSLVQGFIACALLLLEPPPSELREGAGTVRGRFERCCVRDGGAKVPSTSALSFLGFVDTLLREPSPSRES